ncbi:hypothetical protein [Streptomyces sp. NPDC059389]|uniref:preATP grasp domain-containing protein n=1 Tax=Streptomyces sp. NPDC059389 TaxID=3346818 RepID=UPI0036C858D3
MTPEREGHLGSCGGRLTWLLEPGGVLVLPQAPDPAFLDYVLELKGLTPDAVTVLVPPPGRFGEGVLTGDRLLAPAFLELLRSAVARNDVSTVLPLLRLRGGGAHPRARPVERHPRLPLPGRGRYGPAQQQMRLPGHRRGRGPAAGGGCRHRGPRSGPGVRRADARGRPARHRQAGPQRGLLRQRHPRPAPRGRPHRRLPLRRARRTGRGGTAFRHPLACDYTRHG